MIYEEPNMEIIILDNTISTLLVSGGEDLDPDGEMDF